MSRFNAQRSEEYVCSVYANGQIIKVANSGPNDDVTLMSFLRNDFDYTNNFYIAL